MSDDEQGRLDQVVAAIPPAKVLDENAVKRWVEFQGDADLILHISRGDIDNLFFAIQELGYAVTAVQRSIYFVTEGQLDQANASHTEAQARTIHSANRMTDFIGSLMAKAEVVG